MIKFNLLNRKLLGTAVILAAISALLSLYTVPVHAGASGSFSGLSFPNCDLQVGGAKVHIDGGTMHIKITSGDQTLKDDSRGISGGDYNDYTIGFAEFAKPDRSSIRVRIDIDGTQIADVSGDYPDPCRNFDPSSLPAYLRDGRADPQPWDRLAVWCSKDQKSFDVWGVGNDSRGYWLGTFNQKDLAKAGPDGITREVKNLGAISVSMDNQNNLWISWNGGPFGANGRDGFGKALNCKW